jgi:hypothetical protein
LVIEDFVCNVWRNPQPRHPRHASPTQIMQAPAGNARELIQLAFGPAKFIEWSGSEHRENEWAVLVCAFEYAHRCFGKMYDMLLAVLCSRFGERPNSLNEV